MKKMLFLLCALISSTPVIFCGNDFSSDEEALIEVFRKRKNLRRAAKLMNFPWMVSRDYKYMDKEEICQEWKDATSEGRTLLDRLNLSKEREDAIEKEAYQRFCLDSEQA